MSRRADVADSPACSACGVGLDDSNWQLGQRAKRNYKCRTCHNKHSAAWRRDHPEEQRALGYKWAKGHPEKERASQAKWRKANPESVRARRARYNAKREAEYVAKLGHGDPSKVYYVYELYTIMSNGREKVYYVGQGKNGRVYDHEKAYRRKIRNPRTLLSPKEKMMLFIEDNGWPLLNRIVQSGLNQDQAFNLENEVITHYGLQNLTNIARPRRIRVVTE